MPNRILRDTTDSENVNKLSILCEVFYYRLMMKADDFGSFHSNSKLLKANLFPLRDNISLIDIENCLKELTETGLIFIYKVDEREFLRITRFGQRLRNMRNKFPEPQQVNKIDGELTASCGETPPETNRSRIEVETKRNEVNKKELIFDEKYKFYYAIINGEKLVGNETDIKNGGLSIFAIRKHCQDLGIEYGGEYGE